MGKMSNGLALWSMFSLFILFAHDY